MVGPTECNVDFSVDVLVASFPEDGSIEESAQQPVDNLVEVNFQVTFKEVEDHDHVYDREEGNHNGTQQIQDDNPIGDAVVA